MNAAIPPARGEPSSEQVERAAKAYEEAFNGPTGWTTARDQPKLLRWMRVALTAAIAAQPSLDREALRRIRAWTASTPRGDTAEIREANANLTLRLIRDEAEAVLGTKR